eukprot:scaffold22382_cov47-Attheya_sp.AAC.5
MRKRINPDQYAMVLEMLSIRGTPAYIDCVGNGNISDEGKCRMGRSGTHFLVPKNEASYYSAALFRKSSRVFLYSLAVLMLGSISRNIVTDALRF